MSSEQARHLAIYTGYLRRNSLSRVAVQFENAITAGDRSEAKSILKFATGAYVRQIAYVTEVAAFGPSTKHTYAWASDTAKHKSVSAIEAHKSGRYVVNHLSERGS